MKRELFDTLEAKGISSRTIKAMEKVDRNLFVDSPRAWQDTALSIGHGQTISQPYTVAFMIDLLELKKQHKVLEIGAGSGYNAAVMAQLADTVYSVEIIEELVSMAKSHLEKANISNVEVIHTSGSNGYEKQAPYDRIIATAGRADIPQELMHQLKKEGIMVFPRTKDGYQVMQKIVKDSPVTVTEHGRFSFVPFV